jgi:transglutaminase-like putative cysteine protease
MRLKIAHTTRYAYDAPVLSGLQQVRMTPKESAGQRVLAWDLQVTGGTRELSFEDAHRNRVDLISFTSGTRELTLTCTGEVEMTETHGITGQQGGFMPLWMFLRATPLTRAGSGVRRLAGAVQGNLPLDRLHDLSRRITAAVAYETGVSHVGWTAEDALSAGHGVCQDMAHVFVAAARMLGVPARYVSGYLMMQDRVAQDATHAWAEAHVEGLGWVGFDPSNGISPDMRYVRVATGLDYAEAAPVSGLRTGTGEEHLTVTVAVAQVQQ